MAEGKEVTDECREVIDAFGSVARETFCEGVEDCTDFRLIRVEKQPDACLKDMSDKNDIIRKIDAVKKEQCHHGKVDLYPRKWSQLGSIGNDQSTISVLQFNTLAEGLSFGPDSKKPFLIDHKDKYDQRDKGDYGGFTDIPCPSVTLDFQLRRWRLLEVILGSDGSAPFDLIALEEVDRYHGFFAPVLRMFGYDGVFMPKARSPGVGMGWYSDGCCLFWKKSCFELITERRLEYSTGSQMLIIVTLRHNPSGTSVVVAVTHLKSKKNEKNEKMRCQQVEELLGHVEDAASDACKRDDVNRVPIFLVGDFNADPPSQIAGTESSVERVLKAELSGVLGPFCFRSAYQVDPPQESFYTTWKTRGPETFKRVIDYIFYSDDARCQAILSIPAAKELEPTKLPGLRYPSDHMAVAAKFVIE